MKNILLLICALAVYAGAFAYGAENAETSLWHDSLTKPLEDFTFYKYSINHKDAAVFGENGIEFADDGKRTSGFSAILEFPKEVAHAFHEGEVIVTFEMKVDGVENDIGFGWVLKGETFTQWAGKLVIPHDAKGWNLYELHPWQKPWPDLRRFFFNIPVPKKGSVYLRNMTVRRKQLNIDLKPYMNAGYECNDTPRGRQNCFGEITSDFRRVKVLPWQKYAGVPLKPLSHRSGAINTNEMVRFCDKAKISERIRKQGVDGIKKLVIPVSEKNFSARKLYLLHALYKGGDDFKGKVTVRGKNDTAVFEMKFNRDIKNLDDLENKSNAFKGLVIPTNWDKDIHNIPVSEFDIPRNVGAIEDVTVESDPGSGVYVVLGMNLSNFEFELDKRPLKVVKRNEEWVPFPFPKKAGVLPGSVLDTGAKKPVAVGVKGRLVSTAEGEVVAEKEKTKPMRFRMQGTGGWLYDAPKPKNYDKYVKHLMDKGEVFFTDFIFTPYSDDFKRSAENGARMYAMQNYNMMRVCGLHDFTADFGIDFTAKEMDSFFYFVKCMKENGIYIHLDIGHSFCKGRAWTDENGAERTAARKGISFDTKWRNHLKEGMRKVLSFVNPYTGLALKDDPIVVFINGWNENPIEFRRYTEPEAIERFSKFLGLRYKDIDALKAAWGSEADKSWQSFKDVPVDFSGCIAGKAGARKKDVWEFYIESSIERLDWFKRTLREIGYKGMISDYNFAQALEGMRSRMFGDYVVMNRYHEHPLTEWIANESPIETKNDLMRAMASVRFLDRPYVITETGICYWNNYRYEQPFILDAYAALNGIDVLTNFAGILPNRGHGFQRKDVTQQIRTFFGTYDPIMFAAEFLGAHFFNLGKIKTAETKVKIELDEKDVSESQDFNCGLGDDQTIFALICQMGVEWKDDKRTSGENEMVLPRMTKTGIVREKMFAYAVKDKNNKFDGDACIAEMKKRGLIPANNRTSVKDGIFESVTGELYMDSSKKFGAVNTPKAQGVFALAGTTYKLPQFEVKEMTANGMLNVVASDDEPIGESKRLTVVYATNALNEGLTLFDDQMKKRVMNGNGCTLYQTGKFTVTIKNKNAAEMKAYVVRLDGTRDGELPMTVNGDELTLSVDTAKIPGGPAIFFELADK